MFYAHFVLAKKGPLSKIWLAAHWDKKLTKAHVFETNIETSVDGILKPKVKMALRTSGHLLLGVVRIYSRKAKYLLQDCNEAFVKIKMAFRPGMVDLPEEHREAAMNAITLPEVFHDFDTAMPELNEVDIEAQFSLNQSRAEEITMREDYGSLNLVTHDDGFGDMGFDTDNPDIMREAIDNDGMEQSNLLFADGSALELGGAAGGARAGSSLAAPALEGHARRMEAAPHAHLDDGFGGTIGDDADFGHAGGLFEGDLFGDVTAGSSGAGSGPGMPGTSAQPQSLQAEIEAAGVRGAAEAAAAAAAAGGDEAADSDDDMGADQYDAGVSPDHSWAGSPAPSLGAAELMPPPAPRPPSVRPMEVDPAEPRPESAAGVDAAGAEAGAGAGAGAGEGSPPHDNTTLLQNDEESFALAPVDATVLKGITKTRRKRKLIVDEVKNISGEEMKNQLSNTADIVSTLDLAPPTRRLMHWKETGGVEKLFTLSARPIPSRILFKKYQRNMSRASEAAADDEPRAEPAHTRRRKRKHDELVPPETPAPEPEPPVPQDYEPSIAERSASPARCSPRADDDAPATPGMLSSLGPPLTPGPLTPGALGPLTPGPLLPGGLTPAGLQHGDLDGGLTPQHLHSGLAGALSPPGLHHGGLTPGGLDHGGMTPAGLQHGGMTPAGLTHGGLTPAGLGHGGMTPAGLGHGGMTPAGLGHGGMTPAGLGHGGMTPAGLVHGGMTPAGLAHGGMTPAGLLHGLEAGALLRSDPSLQSQALEHGLQHAGLAALPHYDHDQSGMQMTNLGYDDGNHSPQHDYDLPPSVEQAEEQEREAGETDEQFEERLLNRRAAQLLALLRPRLAALPHTTFADLAPRHNHRKQVAQKFYSLLVLKKHQVIKLEQAETYGPLLVSRGAEFETAAL